LQQGDSRRAVEKYREALRQDPGLLPAKLNLAVALAQQQRWDEAFQTHDEAATLARGTPFADVASRNRMTSLQNYQSHLFELSRSVVEDPSAVFKAHLRLVDYLGADALTATAPYKNSRDPDRRLRIGYLSPDFRLHSVAYFIEPVIASHDRGAVEVFCYYTCPRRDAVTRRIEALADHWRECAHLGADSLADQIRMDGIDILVDLAGHTTGNRWPTLAAKPAPIQIAYLGYPATTGLKTVDYRLTDRIMDPPGLADDWFVEPALHVEGAMVVYRPPFGPGGLVAENVLDIGPLPASANGFVTFGCFNDATKLNAPLLDCWCRLLRRVPGSRLLLKSRHLAETQSAVVALRERMAACGIEAARLCLRAHDDDEASHLLRYGNVDIALDPFPYNGVTTSLEAMYMAVPFVTLAGLWPAARMGATIATHIGHSEWIATTPEEYVGIAAGLAADRPALLALRNTLREALLASSLTDGAAFTRRLEATYRQAWKTWCEQAASWV
jgi:predicted O-linked N-acetylglucosamine transferase (SPINDLY family)